MTRQQQDGLASFELKMNEQLDRVGKELTDKKTQLIEVHT
jgi:hypothetical protein